MSVIVEPGRTFLDNSGRVLSSGTVTFYKVGQTVTKKIIFATAAHQAAGTPALSNPQTLNSAGRLNTQVHTSGQVRMVVKSSTGATILDEDYVSALPAPAVSIQDFGADPTGVADSYAAVVAAFDALGETGGTVNVPAGTYKIATAIQWPVLGYGVALRLVGVGTEASRFNFTGTGYLFTWGDGSPSPDYAFYPEVRDMSLVGNGAVGQLGCIKLNGAYFWRVINCYIHDFTTAGAKGIYSVPGGAHYHGMVHGCFIRNIPRGISFEGTGGFGANSNRVVRSWFGVHSDAAIYIDGGDTNLIYDNEFNGSTTTAIKIENDANGNKIIENQFDGPTTAVQFVGNTPQDTYIAGNTGSVTLLSGRGTGTTVIDPTTGIFHVESGMIIGSAASVNPAATALTVVAPTSASTHPFIVSNSTGQYLFRVNQAGATEAYGTLASHGKLTVANDVVDNTVVAEITNVGAATSNTLLILKGATSQTGNAVEIQNSAGTVLALVTASGRIHFGATTSAPGIMSGTGTPEGAVAAPIGSLFLRTDGGAGTSLYVKQSGTGNTGWVGK